MTTNQVNEISISASESSAPENESQLRHQLPKTTAFFNGTKPRDKGEVRAKGDSQIVGKDRLTKEKGEQKGPRKLEVTKETRRDQGDRRTRKR